VRAAIQNAGFEFPNRRITANLAPADLPKESGRFDLPIALGILAASRRSTPERWPDWNVGELSLSGELRPIRGALAMASQCQARRPCAIAARGQRRRGARVDGATVLPPATQAGVRPPGRPRVPRAPPGGGAVVVPCIRILADVKGQALPKRALEIAPPAAIRSCSSARRARQVHGWRRASRRAAAQAHQEALKAPAPVHTGPALPAERWGQRPYRAPHHSASAAALVGGGSHPLPGEISLAHHGVLFLDELPEFERRVLEALREPLETGQVSIARAARRVDYPARFQLVAAMNPCPCGYLGHTGGRCRCTPDQVARYRGKLSGPLLDRIDMSVEVPALSDDELRRPAAGDDSAAVRQRVAQARARQLARQGKPNQALTPPEVERHCAADEPALRLLGAAMARLKLSARAYHRVLRVARSIADLADAEAIGGAHVAEAIQLRRAHPAETA